MTGFQTCALPICDRRPEVTLTVRLSPQGADLLAGAEGATLEAEAPGTAAFDSLHSLLMSHSARYGRWFLGAAAARALAAVQAREDAESSEEGG